MSEFEGRWNECVKSIMKRYAAFNAEGAKTMQQELLTNSPQNEREFEYGKAMIEFHVASQGLMSMYMNHGREIQAKLVHSLTAELLFSLAILQDAVPISKEFCKEVNF